MSLFTENLKPCKNYCTLIKSFGCYRKYKIILLLSSFLFHRLEDHDDMMCIFEEQANLPALVDQPYFLAQLIRDQSEESHIAVCEVHLSFNVIFEHIFVEVKCSMYK